MQHLDEGTIHTWLDGELSAVEAEQAERHVAECAECAAAVAEARGMIAGASRIVSALDVGLGAVTALPRQTTKPAVPRSAWRSLRLTPTRAALAASLLVAAGALLTIRHDTPDKMRSAESMMSADVPRAAPAPSPAVVMAPAMDSAASNAPVSTRAAARTPVSRKAAESVRADSATQRQVPSAVGLAPASGAGAAGASAMPKVSAAPPALAGAAANQSPPAAAPPASVATDARVDAQRALVDSMAAKTTAGMGGAANPQRRTSGVMQLQEIVTTATGATSARGLDVAGCYQIKSDSGALLRLLPDRFALERAPGSGVAASNVVRAVTPDGRKDSVVTGSNWVQLDNDKAQIRSIVGTRSQVVSLQLTSLGVSGKATTAGGTHIIDVSRAVCRP